MVMLWLGPEAYVTGDPTLALQYPSSGSPATTVSCSALTPSPKSISVTLPVPPLASIGQVEVCYQVSSDKSFIARTRLREMTAPGTATVKLDDATPRQSTSAVCYTVDAGRIAPAGAIILELQLQFTDLTHTIILGGIGIDVEGCANEHGLGEFATFADALDAIAKQGGGLLCIPHDAPAGLVPRNLPKSAGVDRDTVTVIDYRQGVEHTYAPPIGITNSEASAVAGRLIERDLAVTLPWQNVFSVADITSRCPGGASSVSMPLTTASTAGTAKKIHVPTLRGLFKGQQLQFTDANDLVTVDDLGVDAQGPYFVANPGSGHSAGALVYNKNNVADLTITDTSNCDTQSGSLQVTRTTYGTGDTFGIAAILRYQGNIMSAGGDEGGVAVAANLEHDIDCFYGVVESWDAANHLLRYKEGFVAPQKLGTSRPIINLETSKQVRDGMVTIDAAGAPIVGDATASAKWSNALVNRFIAINEPEESYERDSPAGAGKKVTVLRWWLITKIETAGAQKKIYIERPLGDTGGPALFRAGSYRKPLHYIIAPGAWASDVRDGVAGNVRGNVGYASVNDKRTITLAPAPTDGTADDFAPGDAITNPPGPDVWTPTAFRARNVPQYPALLPGISFLSENLGTVQMGAALSINGSGDSSNIDDVHARMKDANAEYDSGILIDGSTHKAIVLRGAVEDAAIELWGSNKNNKVIRWLDDAASLAGSLVLDLASRDFVFTSSRDFVFKGRNLDLAGGSTFHQNGLSATGQPAANLGGRGVPVAMGVMKTTVGLRITESDTGYSVFVQCSWMTASIISNKTQTTFDVEFEAGPPKMEGGTFDWFLVRLL